MVSYTLNRKICIDSRGSSRRLANPRFHLAISITPISKNHSFPPPCFGVNAEQGKRTIEVRLLWNIRLRLCIEGWKFEWMRSSFEMKVGNESESGTYMVYSRFWSELVIAVNLSTCRVILRYLFASSQLGYFSQAVLIRSSSKFYYSHISRKMTFRNVRQVGWFSNGKMK